MSRTMLLLTVLCTACTPDRSPPAAARLADRAEPAALVADVDCDARPDSARVLRSDTVLTVEVFRAAATAPEQLSIPVSSDRQLAVCMAEARLAAEPLTYLPGRDDIPRLEGFQSSATCHGLSLTDDRCDALHLYWDGTRQRFGQWRR